MIHLRSRAAIAVLAFVALGAVPLSAQSVTGTVTGAGQAVAGAAVRVLDLGRIARTDAAGRFRLDHLPAGTYRLFTSAIGYRALTDTVEVGATPVTLSLTLVPSPIPVAPIVVTAAPTPSTADELYQPAQSRGRSALAQQPGITFSEKIADLPGVAMRGNGSAPSRPILRGLGDNEVLVLENGLRMGDIATYDPAHATPIDALSIAQVDVVRGPASVLYGPNTIGGVVNLVTTLVPAPADHPLSGVVALDGNTGSEGYSAFADNIVTLGRSAFHVGGGGVNSAATRIPSGNYTDPGSGATFALSEIPQSFDRSSQEMAGYSYQGGSGMIGAGFRHYHMNYGIPGVPPNPNFDSVPPSTSRIVQDRNTFELRGLLNTPGALVDRLRLRASYNDYGHSEFPTAQDSTGVSDPQANHFHKREFNGVLQLDQHPAGRLTGTVGLWADVQDLDISGDQPLGPDSRTTGLAGYAYEEYAAGADTRLQAGARFDYTRIQTRPDPTSTDSVFRTSNESRLSNAVTASLGIIHRLSSHLTAALSAARSFRAPTVQELFADGLDAPSGTYTVGTATLGPEHGYGVDASLRGEFDGGVFELSPYVNYVDGYIYGFLRGDTIQGFPVRQFGATNARLLGFEASATVAASRWVVLQGSADYVNAEDTRAGVPLPFTPPLRGMLRATWEGRSGWGMVEWRLAASQTRLGDGDTPTDGYAVMNLGLGIRLGKGATTSEIGLHCDNVFNTVYRDNLSVIKDFIPQPGRAFRVEYQLLY